MPIDYFDMFGTIDAANASFATALDRRRGDRILAISVPTY
jgi:hypothetical protein